MTRRTVPTLTDFLEDKPLLCECRNVEAHGDVVVEHVTGMGAADQWAHRHIDRHECPANLVTASTLPTCEHDCRDHEQETKS